MSKKAPNRPGIISLRSVLAFGGTGLLTKMVENNDSRSKASVSVIYMGWLISLFLTVAETLACSHFE